MFGAVLRELSGGREDDETDVSITENRELTSLLDKTISSLGEGHLPRCLILYLLYLDLPSSHLSPLPLISPVLFLLIQYIYVMWKLDQLRINL